MTRDDSHTRLTDRKRTAIIKAAVEQFRSRGFDNTTMEGIALAAEVSKRTVYNHFPSKEALFVAIVDGLKAHCHASANYAYDQDVTLEKQLTEIGRAAIALFTSEDFQDLARVVLPRFLQSPNLTRSMMGEPAAGITRWIRAAHDAGRLDVPKPKWAAKQFLGLLHSVAFWPQVLGGELPLIEQDQATIVRAAVAMFLSQYAT